MCNRFFETDFKMNIRETFWSYQLNSTVNLAHLPQNWAKLAKSAVAGTSKTAPRIFIFSIVLGAKYWVYYFSLFLTTTISQNVL